MSAHNAAVADATQLTKLDIRNMGLITLGHSLTHWYPHLLHVVAIDWQ